MAVASTYDDGSSVTVDEFVLDAYKAIGAVDDQEKVTSESVKGKLDWGRRELQRVMSELSGMGLEARLVGFFDLSMVVGTNTYTLSSEYQRVIGDGMYIAAGQDLSAPEGMTLVRQVSRQDWHRRTTKASQGTPYELYAHRAGTDYAIDVYVWPTPDEAGTIRLQVERAVRSAADNGSASLDIGPKWRRTLLYALGADLAPKESLPISRCAYFAKRAMQYLDVAVAGSNQDVNEQPYLDHPVRCR